MREHVVDLSLQYRGGRLVGINSWTIQFRYYTDGREMNSPDVKDPEIEAHLGRSTANFWQSHRD